MLCRLSFPSLHQEMHDGTISTMRVRSIHQEKPPSLAVDLDTSPPLWGRKYCCKRFSMGFDQPSLFRPEHGWEVIKGKPPHRVMVLGVSRDPSVLLHTRWPNAPGELRPTGKTARKSPKSLRCGPSAPLGGYAAACVDSRAMKGKAEGHPIVSQCLMKIVCWPTVVTISSSPFTARQSSEGRPSIVTLQC
jgi:hypothetical protein